MFEGFRPPYADKDVTTGFSGVVIKTPDGQTRLTRTRPVLEQDTPEPTESEVGLSADLDEGTVFSSGRPATQQEDEPKIYEAPIMRKERPIKGSRPQEPMYSSYPSNHQEHSP